MKILIIVIFILVVIFIFTAILYTKISGKVSGGEYKTITPNIKGMLNNPITPSVSQFMIAKSGFF